MQADFNPSAIPSVIFVFLILPLAPAVIVGWILGKQMRGVSIAGGVTLGVLCGIARVALQPVSRACSTRHVVVPIHNGMFLGTPIVSAALSALVCCLWNRVFGS